MKKTIVITSGKGGVGKTSISVNTALELAAQGNRTCLFDADLGLANVNILLDVHPEQTLNDVIYGAASLKDIIVTTDYGIDVIPGSSGIEAIANLGPEEMEMLIGEFEELNSYDYLLLDTSSGISRSVISLCLASPETLLVITSEATSLADGYSVLKVLSLNEYEGKVRILVNKCTTIPQAKKVYQHFKTVVDKHLDIEIHPGGAVLADPMIAEAVSCRKPLSALAPTSVASQCIKAMTANLMRTEDDGEQADKSGAFWKRYLDLLDGVQLPGDTGKKRTFDETGGEPAELHGAVEAEVVEVEPDTVELPREKFTFDSTTTLPSPASGLAYILELSPNVSLSDYIRTDPSLLGQVIQVYTVANGVLPGGISNLEDLVGSLDEERLAGLIRSKAMHALLLDHGCDPLIFSKQWAYNYRTALLCRFLAEQLGYYSLDEAYLAGLLHDAGRMALQSSYSDFYQKVDRPYMHSGITQQFEEEVAGSGHGELGAEILKSWGMSCGIVDAARYHGESLERIASSLLLTKIAAVASLLCQQESGEQLPRNQAAKLLGLSMDDLHCLLDDVDVLLQDDARKFGISFDRVDNRNDDYRRFAADFAVMQTMNSNDTQLSSFEHALKVMQQGLSLLFGLHRSICFFADSNKTRLRAVGFNGCFGQHLLSGMEYSLKSSSSCVVHSFNTSVLKLVADLDEMSLADRQLFTFLGGDGLLLMPLNSSTACHGVVACAVNKAEFSSIERYKKQLQSFSFQVTSSVANL